MYASCVLVDGLEEDQGVSQIPGDSGISLLSMKHTLSKKSDNGARCNPALYMIIFENRWSKQVTFCRHTKLADLKHLIKAELCSKRMSGCPSISNMFLWEPAGSRGSDSAFPVERVIYVSKVVGGLNKLAPKQKVNGEFCTDPDTYMIMNRNLWSKRATFCKGTNPSNLKRLIKQNLCSKRDCPGNMFLWEPAAIRSPDTDFLIEYVSQVVRAASGTMDLASKQNVASKEKGGGLCTPVSCMIILSNSWSQRVTLCEGTSNSDLKSLIKNELCSKQCPAIRNMFLWEAAGTRSRDNDFPVQKVIHVITVKGGATDLVEKDPNYDTAYDI